MNLAVLIVTHLLVCMAGATIGAVVMAVLAHRAQEDREAQR